MSLLIQAIHDLLAAYTVQQAQRLQIALGQLRRASGHFRGQLLAITPHWAGFATAKQPFGWSHSPTVGFMKLFSARGEAPRDYYYKSFLATADRPEVADLSANYPQRWHVEEFFKFNQALGWHGPVPST